MAFPPRPGRTLVLGTLLLAGTAWSVSPAAAPDADHRIPTFTFDPDWPAPLPNHWTLGAIGGLHVDGQNRIWIVHRGHTRGPVKEDMVATPGDGCCTPAPPVVVFNRRGRVIRAWGTPNPNVVGRTWEGYAWPSEHGIYVDRTGHVWTGCEGGARDRVTGPDNCGSVTRFRPDGRILWQKGRTGMTRGNADQDHFNSPTDIAVDERAHEAFVADGYRNQRIAVIDVRTGAFKRMWGPFGQPPQDIPRTELNGGTSGRHDQEGLATFGDAVHCIAMSRDGLLYVCDRGNNRIQVFRKDGTFVQEAFVAPETRGIGSVFDIAFSADRHQRFLYVLDGTNHRIHILRREDLAVLGGFGDTQPGRGGLGLVHVLATDSRGDVYVGETGSRNQLLRFRFTGLQEPSAQAEETRER